MAAGDLRLGEQVRVQVERLAAAHAAPARGLPRGLGGHRRGEVLHAPGLPGTALGEKYLLSTVSIKIFAVVVARGEHCVLAGDRGPGQTRQPGQHTLPGGERPAGGLAGQQELPRPLDRCDTVEFCNFYIDVREYSQYSERAN